MRHARRLILALVVAAVAAAPAMAGFRTLDNTAFASRCNGPLGAIVAPQDSLAMQTAGTTPYVYWQHSAARLASAEATMARLERLGLVGRGAEARFPRTIVRTVNGKLLQPDLARTAQTGGLGSPTNDLTFTWEGWNSGDQAALAAYLKTAMPKAKLIYGPPAFNLTVKIIQDTSLSTIQGGTYDAAANEIRIPPLSGNFPEDTIVLLMLVLNAFHDDAVLYYDAWEQGLIGAAAYVIQTQPGVSPGYDPVDPGPFYCLSVYECENQPELGNSTFFPTSGATNMLVWRIAMARAAWLKCWIENPQFFAAFNAQYYANYSTTVPGDVPYLKELAALAVPTVEGLPFAEWYERQYVLDTSIRSGPKLYTWNIPLTDSVALISELYHTSTDGDETPAGAQGRTTYWNEDYDIQLYAEEGNLLSIPSGGSTPGEGYLIPTFYNIGGPQRIGVQIDVAGLRHTYLYPYGMRGFYAGENNLYGAIDGENTGVISVTGGNGLKGVTVGGGVWGDRITAASLSPMQVKVTFETEAGEATTRTYNIGWDSYCCLMTAGGQATASHTFAYGLTGLHLMSLPLAPLDESAPSVLRIAAERLLLVRWDPLAAGDNKYRFWPSFPFRSPGNGYWLRVEEDTTVSLTGVEADPDKDYAVPLAAGWNLVGSPRLTDVPVTDLQVQEGTSNPVAWADAVSTQLVQRGVYGYSQTGGYELADAVQPWQGYWVRCLKASGVRLVFPAASTTAMRLAASSLQSSSALRWRVPIVVSAGPLHSATAYLGGADTAAEGPDTLDMTAPPSFGDYVEARFVHGDWGRNSGRYVTDVRPATAAARTWQMQVVCTEPRTNVTVSWPTVTGLPRGTRLMISDPASGRRLAMDSGGQLAFRAGVRGAVRNLVIEQIATDPHQLIGALEAFQTARKVTVLYWLGGGADVTVTVHDGRGREIARPVAGRRQGFGQQRVTWNLGAGSRAVAPGTYYVAVKARAGDGRSARVVTKVVVSR